MSKCWIIVLLPIALAGCDEQPAPTPQTHNQRFARINAKMSGIQAKLSQREARLSELQEHSDRLSVKLRRSELTNHQLRLRLDAVGDSPLQRDRHRKLSAGRALEIQRLQARVRQLLARLERGGARTAPPATPPADPGE